MIIKQICLVLHIIICFFGSLFLGMIGLFTALKFKYLMMEDKSHEEVDYIDNAIPFWIASGAHLLAGIGLLMYHIKTKRRSLHLNKRNSVFIDDLYPSPQFNKIAPEAMLIEDDININNKKSMYFDHISNSKGINYTSFDNSNQQ